MVVCIEPSVGFFFRINTNKWWPNSVALPQATNKFLDHDSYIECGSPLDLDEYIVEQSLRGRGVIGRVDPALAPVICAMADKCVVLSAQEKRLIRAALGC